MLEDFDCPIFGKLSKTYHEKTKSIVDDIKNNKKIDFPMDADHITLPNTAEEIKTQKIEEEKVFLEKQLKKNEGDAETLESLLD